MFTGLVEGRGKIRDAIRRGKDMRLTVSPLLDMSDLQVGDSVSVEGVCLTVTEVNKGFFSVDVSSETLLRSTLGLVKQGDEVNLERSLKVGDRIGGHLVSGHVDGVGKIAGKERAGDSWVLRIEIKEDLARYIVNKGSVAVDGISLTVNRCDGSAFEVNIIPETAAVTGILKKKSGDLVNIETDIIGKYVEKFLSNRDSVYDQAKGSRIDEKMLRDYGFDD
ncbi:MAG: riboflavin synthase [Deltaproteobacteria bacterium]|nr:riboflavin synthase [Deltaproteobacteria bacterium]